VIGVLHSEKREGDGVNVVGEERPCPQEEPAPEDPSNAKSAARALAVLKLLASRTCPIPATTIARECRLPRSSAYHLLKVMHDEGFVAYYHGDRTWGLGVTAFELGSAYLRSKPLERLGWPVLKDLATRVGETAHLGVMHGNESLILLKWSPSKPGPSLVTAVGVRLPAHLTGVGRAMLMSLPTAQLRALYPAAAAPLVRRTGKGPTHRIELERELGESRARGYAVDDDFVTKGIACIAAPVYSYDNHPMAAVSISFISAQHPKDEWNKLAIQVRATASKLSKSLGFRGLRSERSFT
jgi:DNA-binding IclR family transcriptional regulator